MPLGSAFGGPQDVARAVLFDSGRPVIVFGDDIPERVQTLDLVVLAWDGGPAAARAMADALPILRRAGEVRVLTVAGDKQGVDDDQASEALRHLRGHGVNAVADVVHAHGKTIGQVLSGYLLQHDADLLVMGAFGHSRLRDFILGGATGHMLGGGASTPVMMSH